MDFPTVSIVIPTLNSAKTIGVCLDSILKQDYPWEKIEVIISDGGSIDNTLDIVKTRLSNINYRLFANTLKTGEAGKAVGVKETKNEIIALIDSDNILPQPDWFERMVEPFQDKEIIASEPLYYTYRLSDRYITRYCALLGMNDPICLWFGNYDRYCTLTGKWTELIHNEEDRGNYLKVGFPDLNRLPTIGANGFSIRANVLYKEKIGDYLFDIDILQGVLSGDRSKIAKVKIGIVHIFSGTKRSFFRKQTRRIRDYSYYRVMKLRKYSWDRMNKIKTLEFIFDTLFIFPLLIQSLNGYLRKKDLAWFFHPIACLLTLIAYTIGTLRGLINIRPQKRSRWGQF